MWLYFQRPWDVNTLFTEKSIKILDHDHNSWPFAAEITYNITWKDCSLHWGRVMWKREKGLTHLTSTLKSLLHLSTKHIFMARWGLQAVAHPWKPIPWRSCFTLLCSQWKFWNLKFRTLNSCPLRIQKEFNLGNQLTARGVSFYGAKCSHLDSTWLK